MWQPNFLSFNWGSLTQKLPARLRNQFEERHGSSAELPTFSKLMGLLDEVCRRQLIATPLPEQERREPTRLTRSPPAQRRAGRSPPQNKVRGQVATISGQVRCIYCKVLGHRIQECYGFTRLSRSAKKTWVRSKGVCFVCLGEHFARECDRGTGCGLCGAAIHHTLLCNADGGARGRVTQQPSRPASPRTPPRARTPPRRASPPHHVLPAPPPRSPPREEPRPYDLERGARRVGTRYQRAQEQFRELRNCLNPTVTLAIKNSRGDFEEARALLDTGASVSAIREVLVDRLRLHRQKSSMEIVGIGNTTVRTPASKVKIVIKPVDRPVPIISTVAVVMHELSIDLPVRRSSPRGILKQAPPTLRLADKCFSLPQGVDLILGADVLNYILDGTKVDIGTDGVAAYGTCFGHALMGPVNGSEESAQRQISTTTLTEAVKRFWTSEEPPAEKPRDPRNDECERLYETTTVRQTDGKFMVRLPLLSNRPELGDSLATATRRFYALEKKLERLPRFAAKYREFMEDYEKLGHMSVSNFKFDAEHYVIPHHGIFKKESDKIRVVFDGSCKTTNGVSLNQCLHSGEALQNDITKILMNFRRHRVVFTTDVKQMFRMTWIHPEDRRYQLILWRSDPSQELKVYELNTNTYGLRSSPYIAIRTLLELATQWEETHPNSVAAEVLRHDVFVDDIMGGAETLERAQAMKTELIELMRSAGYELRKWSTNNPQLLKDLPEEHCEQPKQFDAADPRSFIKVLGIQWEPLSDTMSYRLNIPSEKEVTKRSVLSTIARLYDPCGYCTPVIIRFKGLLQELFMDGLHWDEAVPEAIVEKWREMIRDLFHLERLKIPRCIILPNAVSYSLHGFGDASEAGYAACIYLRSEDAFGNVKVSLIIAKSRVAPIKARQTIPKLELSAAHLVCDLLNHVADGYERSINIDSLNAWSDSSIVLAWVDTQPHLLQTFECNRVQNIQNSPRKLTWRHVQSDHNPADCASRGVTADELIHHPLWWSPPWLERQASEWPQTHVKPTDLPGFKRVINTNIVQDEPWDTKLLERVSSFTRLINITAYVLRYINSLRTDKSTRPPNKILTLQETRGALKYWIRRVQGLSYAKEIDLLKQHKRVITPLQKLSVFLDAEGVIRVGGRLRHSQLTYGARHPVLLPKDTTFVQLLMQHYHRSHCHIGANGPLSLSNPRWVRYHPPIRAGSVITHQSALGPLSPTNPLWGRYHPPIRSGFVITHQSTLGPLSSTNDVFCDGYYCSLFNESPFARNPKIVKHSPIYPPSPACLNNFKNFTVVHANSHP
ncbi:hypothetical protein evm_014670 [Chilo suppressalis]|nr:hypothetical protein evm_014670 [Chilo suppressalis]